MHFNGWSFSNGVVTHLWVFLTWLTLTHVSCCHVPSRKSLMSSGLCLTPTPTSSSSASAWSTPPHFTTSPRSGFQRSGLITHPLPSSWLGLSQTFYWTWMSSSTWTGQMSNRFLAPGHRAWRTRSEPQTILSAPRSHRRTWRRRSMRPSLLPLRTKHGKPRRGGFLTDAPKLFPGAAGRSSFASSELRLLIQHLNLFKLFNVTGPIDGS